MDNMIVLDLETARSADDCLHCGKQQRQHLLPDQRSSYVPSQCTTYQPIGWNNKPTLGLSIGGYYDYEPRRIHWFDETNLELTVLDLVETQPLMVSFNGIQFDFPLMRGILRRRADSLDELKAGNVSAKRDAFLHTVCDKFKVLAAHSYDILAEIWRADPSRKFERGLNSLDAISQANGLGAKLSHGAQAPRDWAAGRYADVLNYCQDDIFKTKALFERICDCEGWLQRGDGSEIGLRWIDNGEWREARL